ncbi:MAG: PAS domain S-box protein [Halobacteriales archaeon]|nr:PAS domain S-box protein [Halobacteriales archaeon]
MFILAIESAEFLLFYAFTVGPLVGLLLAAIASLTIIYRLGEKWLLLIVVVMAMMTQHQILEGIEFFRSDGASLAIVQETFETAANLILAGATYYVLSFARDERELAEELERSKNRYNRLVENAPSPIFVVKDLEIVYANPMAVNFFDHTMPDDLHGSGLLQFVHPEDRARLREELEDAIESGYPIALPEIRFDISDQLRRATSMVAPIVYQNGQALQIVLQDITELQEYEQRLDKTLQNTNDAVFIVDPQADEILECNQKACDILGYEREELLSLPASEIHPDEMNRLREFTQTVANEDGARTESLSCRRRDGREIPAEVSGSTIEFQGRDCLLAVVRDISDRKRRERRLSVLDRVLRHNLRNDMNIIIGQADRLRIEATDGTTATIANKIKETAAQLMEMSDDLRRVQSTIDPETEAQASETDASAHIHRIVESYRQSNPDAVIATDVPQELPVQAGDTLSMAFEQLIENAIEHNDNAVPQIEITADTETTDEGWVTISITDNGPGLPEQEKAVFMEDGDITPLQHGSGLGLWIAIWVIEAFGGDVDIGDAQPRGTVVEIHLRTTTVKARPAA